MKKLKFDKLMSFNPTIYDEYINTQGKKVLFCEHPCLGDESPVIVIFPDDKLAFESGFWDIEDMIAEHKEYEPVLIGNDCFLGYQTYKK